jgi:hypothetical protein
VIAAICAVAMSLSSAAADAHVTRKKAMWGPLEVAGRSQFPIYADLGVGIYETNLSWAKVATRRPAHPRDPRDPAYAWPAEIDRAIAQGSTYGIRVSLLVIGTPRWANGGRAPRWAPTRPSDFAAFVEAAARRYPRIRHWMIWSEPTKPQNFQPLTPDDGFPLRGRGLRAPRLYARMLDASYAALKRVNRRNLVIGGNTYTTGAVAPKHWIEALRLPNGRPPRMDLYGHNPFSLRRPNLRRPPLGDGYADFSDLDTLVRWIDKGLRGARPDGRKLKLFLSEFSLPTDHPNYEFNFYLSRFTQASWIAAALRIARRWSRIYTLGYLGLYDDPLLPGGDQVERGLLQRDGTPKPAYDAFKRG